MYYMGKGKMNRAFVVVMSSFCFVCIIFFGNRRTKKQSEIGKEYFYRNHSQDDTMIEQAPFFDQ